jgi:hypothetical protein
MQQEMLNKRATVKNCLKRNSVFNFEAVGGVHTRYMEASPQVLCRLCKVNYWI